MLNGFINLYNQAKGVLKELFKKQSSEGFVCNRKKFYWSLTFPSLSLDKECFDLAGAKIRQTRLVPFDSVSFRNLIMQIKLARRMQSSLPSGINKVLKYDNSSERHSHTVAVARSSSVLQHRVRGLDQRTGVVTIQGATHHASRDMYSSMTFSSSHSVYDLL